MEIENWFNKNKKDLLEELPAGMIFDEDLLNEAAKQCNSAFVVRNSTLNYDWKNSKITNDEEEKFLHVSDATADRYLNI